MTDDDTEDGEGDGSLFAGLVLAGVVVFVLAVTIGHMVDAQPGSLAAWLVAVAATAALLAASYAAIQARRTFGLELARDREQRARADRAEQADLVAAWADGDPTHSSAPVARIVNGSALPVYDVEVEFICGQHRGSELVGLVPPGERVVAWPQTLRDPVERDLVGTERVPPFRVGLKFRDTAGRTWCRDENGVLGSGDRTPPQ